MWLACLLPHCSLIADFDELTGQPPDAAPSEAPYDPPQGERDASAPLDAETTDGLLSLYPSEDTHIAKDTPDTSFGSALEFYVRQPTAPNGAHRIGLVRFALEKEVAPELTPPLFVKKATLLLWAGSNGLELGTATVHRVLEPWVAAVATWKQRMSGVAWSATWYEATPAATFAQPTNGSADGTNEAYQTELPTALVQEWIDNPASNSGIALASTESGVEFYSLDALQSPYTAKVPRLRIAYKR